MADQVNTSGGSGGNTGLALIVGALIVGLLVIAFFVFGGEFDGGKDVDVDIQAPTTESPATGGGGNQGGGQGQ